MKYTILLAHIFSFSYAHAAELSDMVVPKEVQELTQALHEQEDVACISVDGFFAGMRQWPSCSFCNHLKEELFHHDQTIKKWYAAFSTCRCAEHHELARCATWSAGPALGGMFGYVIGNSLAQGFALPQKLISLPLACLAAVQACKLNKRVTAWVSRLLDRRADAAALAACADDAEMARVLTYLEEQEKNALVKNGTPSREDQNEYQLFCINAYDAAQSNLCSFITVNIKFPVPWTFAGDESIAKLQERISFIQKALQKK